MENISTSPNTKNIMEALFKAREKMEPAKRDALNDRFTSRYATLNSVLAAVDVPLKEQNILLLQFPTASPQGKCVRVVTTLQHVPSGEYISCATDIPLAKEDAQGVGSAITYGRRYAITAILGIPTEDDDGNAASTPPARAYTKPKLANPRHEMWNALEKRFAKDGVATRNFIEEVIGHVIGGWEDLTPEEMRMVTRAAA